LRRKIVPIRPLAVPAFSYQRTVAAKERIAFQVKFQYIPYLSDRVMVGGDGHLKAALAGPVPVFLVTLDIFYLPVLSFWLKRMVGKQGPLCLIKGKPEYGPDADQTTFGERLYYAENLNSKEKEATMIQNRAVLIACQIGLGSSRLTLFGKNVPVHFDLIRLAGKAGATILPVLMTNTLGRRPFVAFWLAIAPEAEAAEAELTSRFETMLTTYPEAWLQWTKLT
jgi:hypothetical protein